MSVSNGTLPVHDTLTALTKINELFIREDSEKIKTGEFLEGSKELVDVIGKFGKVFSPVCFDMHRNIVKIDGKFQTDKVKFEFIEDLILSAKENENVVVIDALQWLRRALHFISRIFQYVIDNHDVGSVSCDMTQILKRAYSETLEQYHGWLGTQLFNVLSRFVPNTHCLFYTLALDKHNKVDFVVRDMRKLTERLGICVDKLKHFYEDNNLETFFRA